MAINDDLRDQFVAHTVDLMRTTEGVRNKVLPILLQLEQELSNKVQEADISGTVRTDYQIKRQDNLIKQTKGTIASAYSDTNSMLRDQLLDIADIQNEAIPKLINKVINAELVSTALTRKDLEVISRDTLIQGAPSSEWWKKQSNDLQGRFAQQIRMGVLQGETNDQLVQRIRGKFTGDRRVVEIDGEQRTVKIFAGGIMDISKREATALVRTSVQTISNTVLHETYKENDDVLNGEQFLATLDLRTTPICRAYDGGAWDFEGNKLPQSKVDLPYPGPPPLHYNCRSVMIPITKSWDELAGLKGIPEVPVGTRASMDGEVAGNMNYEEWLKKQSEERQKEVLGPAKWQLWKDNNLTLAQMLDQQGNALTVEELKAKVAGMPPAKPEPAFIPPEIKPATDTRISKEISPNFEVTTKVLSDAGIDVHQLTRAVIPTTNGVFDRIGVSYSFSEDGHQIRIRGRSVGDPGTSISRIVTIGEDGKVRLDNDYFYLSDKKKGAGLGSQIFYEQVKRSQELGLEIMHTEAVGGGEHNGYYTWPRLGYEGPLGDYKKSLLPANLKGAANVSDLMKTAEGRAWWKANGETMPMTFDLREGSQSMKVLEAYMQAKQEAALAEPLMRVTDRLDITIEDKGTRLFFDGKLNKKGSDWLNPVGELKATATVDLRADKTAYMGRIDAMTKGKGFGKELLVSVIDELKVRNITKLEAYIESGNTASEKLFQSVGATLTKSAKEGNYWTIDFNPKPALPPGITNEKRLTQTVDKWAAEIKRDKVASEALKDWVGGGFTAIRSVQEGLGAELGITSKDRVDHYNKLIKSLNELIDNAPSIRQQVWRGLADVKDADALQFVKGAELNFNSFSSWSQDEYQAKRFGNVVYGKTEKDKNRLILEVETKRAAPIFKLAAQIKSPNMYEEGEWLAPTGKYRVVSVESRLVDNEANQLQYAAEKQAKYLAGGVVEIGPDDSFAKIDEMMQTVTGKDAHETEYIRNQWQRFKRERSYTHVILEEI